LSSHHIVREKQEPALLVLGLDNFTDELLGQLLEWSPTVVVTPDSAEQLNAMGIKVDVVMGADNADLQSDIKTIPAKGGNLTQAALTYLTDNGYPAVNIVTDAFLVDDYLPYISRINIVVYHAGRKIYPVHSGFNKWKPAGEAISIISIISEAHNLQVSGLDQVSENEYLTVADGFFTLKFEQPYLLIAEDIL
jgi:thiamine pyrophosphokinase